MATQSAPAKKRATKPKSRQKITEHFSRHYFALMPEKKHHRIIVWVVFFALSALIAVQLLYPPDRALPFARLGTSAVGWQTDLQLETAATEQFAHSSVRFSTGETHSDDIKLAALGAEPEISPMVEPLVEYPLWQRFIPGSLFVLQPRIDHWELSFAETPLSQKSEEVAQKLSRQPVNAELSIRDGHIVAVNEKDGYVVKNTTIIATLKNAQITFDGTSTIDIVADKRPPAKTAAALRDVRERAEHALLRPLVIQANGKDFSPDSATRASWLQLAEQGSGETTLTFNRDKFAEYVTQTLNAQVGAKAGTTNIVLQNGYEVRREAGNEGTEVNVAALERIVGAYLLDGTGTSPLVAEMVTTQPSVIFNNSYTPTRDGLQAYISEKARHGAWISIKQLDGERWSVGADDTDSVVSGSTYKLFVALYLFKEMNQGSITWNTPILDTTTSGCFDRMTIASTNPCALAWLDQFGRGNVNEFVYSKGFSRSTTFIHPEATHTSARDLTTFMIGLEQGSLVSGAQRERLLYSLSHHPYRYGIPTGSKGQVWDKVGFIWDYVNDTAIVHHPRGTYVMTIMTKGQSYGAIAAMTREIERIMYP